MSYPFLSLFPPLPWKPSPSSQVKATNVFEIKVAYPNTGTYPNIPMDSEAMVVAPDGSKAWLIEKRHGLRESHTESWMRGGREEKRGGGERERCSYTPMHPYRRLNLLSLRCQADTNRSHFLCLICTCTHNHKHVNSRRLGLPQDSRKNLRDHPGLEAGAFHRNVRLRTFT